MPGQADWPLLPEHYLNADIEDTMKLAMGLVATMSPRRFNDRWFPFFDRNLIWRF